MTPMPGNPVLAYPHALQRIPMVVRDKAHFHALIKWSNANIGHGSHCWTTFGKIRFYIDPTRPGYNPPRHTAWIVFVPNIDCTPLLSL